MNKTKEFVENKFELIVGFFFIFFLVARIFLRFNPLNYFPHGDSAVFLNIGRKILNGQVPYLDVWDHKGPLLYYINAFGLWAFGLWGVWILQFVLTFTGLYLAYLNARYLWGAIASIAGVLSGYYLLNLFMAGNLTEEYSISFAFLTLGLYFLCFQGTSQKLMLTGMGFLFMCTFFVRPNNIGFQTAIIISMGIVDVIQKDVRGLREKILWFGVGMLILSVPFLIYFGFNNALDEFYDQVFRYNFIYIETSGSTLSFISPFFSSINFLFYMAVASYVVIFYLVVKRITSIQILENRFLLLLLFAFPAELFLSSISGRGFNHYYIVWVPYFVFASGLLISRALRVFSLSEGSNKVLFLLIVVFCFFVFSPFQVLRGYVAIGRYFVYNRTYGIEKNHPMVEYIHDHTDPQDKVLLWGFGRWLTYLIDRESPSEYIYQFALATPGYTTDEMVSEFTRNLESQKPKFIIEAIDYFIPLNSNELLTYEGYAHPGYVDIVKYIEENYHVVKSNYHFDGQFKADKAIKIWILNTAVENSP